MNDPRFRAAAVEEVATGTSLSHNKAYDSLLTRGTAKFWETLANPLIDNIYGPIAEKNHTLGVIVANATLTLPRYFGERGFGRMYENTMDNGSKDAAIGAAVGKFLVKGTDGVDGPVLRGIDGTSQTGAGLDGLIDMLGTRGDAKLIIRQAERHGHWLTVLTMRTRIAVDDAVIVVGGVANPVMAKIAQSKGIELTDAEKPGANAMAKVKYFASAIGGASLMGGYVYPETRTGRWARGFGLACTGASITTGLVSLVQYGRANASIARKIRQHSRQAA